MTTKATVTTAFDKLPLQQKLIAAGIDIMQHKDFCLMAGCVVMGKIILEENLPTAATNGRDEYYGVGFLSIQNRKQFRWVRLHENFHKGLHHCTDYKWYDEKYGHRICNIAKDFSLNGLIYEIDPKYEFCEPPVEQDGTPFPICFDMKYLGMSWLEILRDLLKDQEKRKGKGKGKGGEPGDGEPGDGEPGDGEPGDGEPGDGEPEYREFDEHRPGDKEMTAEEVGKLKRDIEDALHQGKLLVGKLAGAGAGNKALDGMTIVRQTNWRQYIREWITTICAGDDQSRFCPPNKRLLPWAIMPSHFSESCGELLIATDMSGSMMGITAIVLGEIARIAQDIKPSSVRLVWWDTEVHHDAVQVFTLANFDKLTASMRPHGGGGTSAGCVGEYIKAQGLKPKAVIYLTDGYLDGTYTPVDFPVLWGVVDNDRFVPPQGKVIHLRSDIS